jgi:hypothetical protein
LAGLFLPKIIEMAISGIATLLKKAGAKQTEQATSSEIVDLYTTDAEQKISINPKLGCIIGVYGVFADQKNLDAPPLDAAVKRLIEAGLIPKNADVSIVFEAAIVPTADETAFYLDTRYFSVREFIGDRNKRDRAFVATLTVIKPNETADGDAIAVGNIDLGRLQRKETLTIGEPGKFPRYLSNLMPWKQIDEDSKGIYQSDLTRGLAKKRSYMPVTFSFTLTETADGNAFLAALGELLETAKSEAAQEISDLILPDPREKAAEEERDAAEKLYAAEEDAQIVVLEAKAALDQEENPSKIAVLKAELAKAQRAKDRATSLRRAAGLPDLK